MKYFNHNLSAGISGGMKMLLCSAGLAVSTYLSHDSLADVREAVVVDGLVAATFLRTDEGPWLGTFQMAAARLSDGLAMTLGSSYGSGYPVGLRIWGVVGTDYFYVTPSMGQPPSGTPQVGRANMRDVLALDGGEELVERTHREAVSRIMGSGGRSSQMLSPVSRQVRAKWTELQNEWDLFYDTHFTSEHECHLFIVRQDELRWSTIDMKPADPGDRRLWSEESVVPTTITGAFRAMRSGDRLVLVDERGAVYSTPRDGHALIGRIANWPTEEQTGTRAVYLLEDAATHHLRVLEVIDDPEDPEKKIVIALSFNLEEGQENTPFHAEMPSEDVQRALIRLTEAIDESGKQQE